MRSPPPSSFPRKLSGQVLSGGEDCTGTESWQVAERIGSVFQNPRTQFFTVDSTSEIALTLESMGWPGGATPGGKTVLGTPQRS